MTNTYQGPVVERRHACPRCGRRWRSKQRLVRGSLVLAVITNSAAAAISSNANSNVTAILSGSDPSPVSKPPDQTRPRVKAITEPRYEPDFLAIWEATGRLGNKFKAQTSWIKRGRPSVESVRLKWTEYRASLEDWRNALHLVTWFNGWGHTQEYSPAAAPSKPQVSSLPPWKQADRDEEKRRAAARAESRNAAEKLQAQLKAVQ